MNFNYFNPLQSFLLDNLPTDKSGNLGKANPLFGKIRLLLILHQYKGVTLFCHYVRILFIYKLILWQEITSIQEIYSIVWYSSVRLYRIRNVLYSRNVVKLFKELFNSYKFIKVKGEKLRIGWWTIFEMFYISSCVTNCSRTLGS